MEAGMSQWLLLRGLSREARHWADLPQRMAASGLGPATLLDLPGSGGHAQALAPASIGATRAFVRAQARQAGLRPPYRLLAMSLGGMVAVDWAQHHPNEIAALVLINTSMRPFCRVDERLRPRAWPALLRLAALWHDQAARERIVHALTCQRTDTRDADLRDWSAIGASAPVSRASALRQLLAAARFRARAGTPACPVLLLSSAGDGLVNPRCSERLAQAWHAEHRRHPWAGHDLPHDDPGWLAHVLGEAFRR